MHEFSIASSALDEVLARLAQAGARQVSAVTVKVGTLAGVDAEALRFAFGAVSQGTPAEGAHLRIEPVPAVAHCSRCRTDFKADDDYICACPLCGQLSGDLRQGRELTLTRIEMINAPTDP